MYALSADQQFSIYPLNTPEANDGGVIQPLSFGDLRPTAQCDYVIDVLQDLHQPYVVAGSNLRCENSSARLRSTELTLQKRPSYRPCPSDRQSQIRPFDAERRSCAKSSWRGDRPFSLSRQISKTVPSLSRRLC